MSCAKCTGLSLAISVQFTLKCLSQPKIAEKFTKTPYFEGKFTKTPYFEGSRSFKVIAVDSNKKLVTSACYDKQHVCTCLQPFSRYTR